jgi:hypothetical protein
LRSQVSWSWTLVPIDFQTTINDMGSPPGSSSGSSSS